MRKQRLFRLGILSTFILFIIVSGIPLVEAADWADDFNDGNFNGWTVDSGSFSAATNYLECLSSGKIYRASDNVNGTWLFDFWEDFNFGADQRIFFMSTNLEYNLTDGYCITIEYGGISNVTLCKWTGNTRTDLGRTEIANTTGAWVSYNISRTSDGHFEVRRDGSLDISADDDTINTSTYFVYEVFGSGRGLDNIGVAALVTPTTTTTTTTTTVTTTAPPGEITVEEAIVSIVGAGIVFLGIPGAILGAGSKLLASVGHQISMSHPIPDLEVINRRVSMDYMEDSVHKEDFPLVVYLHKEGADLRTYKKQHKIATAEFSHKSEGPHELPDRSIVQITPDSNKIRFSPPHSSVRVAEVQDTVYRKFNATPFDKGKGYLKVEFRELSEEMDLDPFAELEVKINVVPGPVVIRGYTIPAFAITLFGILMPIIDFAKYVGELLSWFEMPSTLEDYAIIFGPIVAILIILVLLAIKALKTVKVVYKKVDAN